MEISKLWHAVATLNLWEKVEPERLAEWRTMMMLRVVVVRTASPPPESSSQAVGSLLQQRGTSYLLE